MPAIFPVVGLVIAVSNVHLPDVLLVVDGAQERPVEEIVKLPLESEPTPALSIIALGSSVVINAILYGCVMVAEDIEQFLPATNASELKLIFAPLVPTVKPLIRTVPPLSLIRANAAVPLALMLVSSLIVLNVITLFDRVAHGLANANWARTVVPSDCVISIDPPFNLAMMASPISPPKPLSYVKAIGAARS